MATPPKKDFHFWLDFENYTLYIEFQILCYIVPKPVVVSIMNSKFQCLSAVTNIVSTCEQSLIYCGCIMLHSTSLFITKCCNPGSLDIPFKEIHSLIHKFLSIIKKNAYFWTLFLNTPKICRIFQMLKAHCGTV